MQNQFNSSSTPSTGSGSAPPVFILDVGTRTIKAGLHTSSAPHLTPSVVGTPKYPRCLPRPSPAVVSSQSDLVVGLEARRQRGLLRLSYPVQNGGAIGDWESARPLLRQSVQSALATSSSANGGGGSVAHALLGDKTEVIYSLVESPFASRPQRARLAEVLFESPEKSTRVGPRAAGVFCGVGPLLALYATGQITGLVVDVGDGGVSTAAAVDGYVVPLCMQHDVSGASGSAMTAYLRRLLYQGGVLGPVAAAAARSNVSSLSSIVPGLACSSPHNLSRGASAGTAQEQELVYDIKEACCSVSAAPLVFPHATASAASATTPTVLELNSALLSAARQAQHLAVENASSAAAASHSYTLPDGGAIHVSAADAVQAAEVCFYPALLGLEGPGVVDAVLNAVAAAPADVQSKLLGNIVLTGGATRCPGFGKRVFRELQQRVDAGGATSGLRGQRVCVTAPEHRAHAGWLGACFVAQLSSFVSHMVVTRSAYEEEGETALAKRVLT
ncbi:putative Actin-like protein [Leptomonas pyrrhocoris]|uniref:Putative Actin-like protein n=1 Tax=Leptomonas pyrrhocoris TaxID=157538 RepID=A0A0M9G9Y9_LEPPY|nr:putative Actin-like protein [Leptomonas pyrrhocoris]KPA85950.1 putative Actin-like protein [Leptomonas pyrrhocoris]|eukprot:XP_015664389.1 putative Actin-like protein [Leptomonas pyrrhocoris]